MKNPSDSISWCLRNDATVRRCFDAGLSLEEIIEILAKEKLALTDRIIALESVCPRAYTLPDGTRMVWRCPDDLVPTVKL